MRPVLVVLALLGLALGFSLDTFLEQRQAGERQGIFDGDNRLALGAVFVATLAAATLREALKIIFSHFKGVFGSEPKCENSHFFSIV